jgi:general secretion pathway protein D
VTEWIYPTEFEIQELDNAQWQDRDDERPVGNNGPDVKFAVEPSSFEKQEVGVKLQVIPRVLPEGQMIELHVEPTVVEYMGDFEYGMQIPYLKSVTENLLAGTTENEIGYYLVSMPQPKFHFREIKTKLSIYNGATIVLGGLITETRKSFEDKVPFFGDLPFIGFLFRSSGEYSEKRNLLIFISARLVDPAGRPIKAATDGRLGANNAAPAATTMGAIEE